METQADENCTRGDGSSYDDFSGFRWLAAPPEGAPRVRNDFFLNTMVNWTGLVEIASSLRSIECTMLEPITYGHSHMIRQIKFRDGLSWIARLAMPPFNFNKDEDYLPTTDYWSREKEQSMQSQCDTMIFIAENSNVPIPRLFHYSTSTANPT